MVVFERISDSCCRSCILTFAIGANGLTVYGFANAVVIFCNVAIVRSTENGMGIVRLDGNHTIVSEIMSALISIIHTL